MHSMERVLRALCAGRARQTVVARLTVAAIVSAVLWLSAGLFMLLEPVA
jgi:hypothetical protein